MNRLSLIKFVLSMCPLVFACGGDDDGNSTKDGGTMTDGGSQDGGDMTDGGGMAGMRSGLIAVTDVTLTNPELAAIELSGAQLSVGWTDTETDTVEPVTGYENQVGGCRIVVYDVGTDQPATPTDEGAVTISGTNNGDIACAFDGATSAYRCASTNAAASGAVPIGSTATYNDVAQYVEYEIMGADFSGVQMRGMWMTVDGFDDPLANGTFAIEGDNDGDTLWVSNANPPLAATTVAGAAGTFATATGAGPVPGGFDFLDDGTNTISIAKASSASVPAFSVDTNANGEGMSLITGTHPIAGGMMGQFYMPHAIALNDSAVNIGCGDENASSCGVNTNGVLKGFTVSGRTTDASVQGLLPNDMPNPVTQYATFSCSAIGKNYVNLDVGAMTAILDTSPTRIQISGSYVAASIEGDTNIVAGHNMTGWTTVSAAINSRTYL